MYFEGEQDCMSYAAVCVKAIKEAQAFFWSQHLHLSFFCRTAQMLTSESSALTDTTRAARGKELRQPSTERWYNDYISGHRITVTAGV